MAKHGAIVIDNFTGDQSAHYYYAGLSNTRAFGKKKIIVALRNVRGSTSSP